MPMGAVAIVAVMALLHRLGGRWEDRGWFEEKLCGSINKRARIWLT